ncbi:MAG: 6-pyruvoyl trahydropterin synthase family protein [Leadbetterella sp.]
MIHITRREQFNAAHKLYNPSWTAEENFNVFGSCSRIHGHNWILWVTVAGEIDANTGYVIDLKKLRDLVREEVISKVDHTYLNEDVEFLTGVLPSTENFAIAIWNILEPIIRNNYSAKLHKIRLAETENHYVEYYG